MSMTWTTDKPKRPDWYRQFNPPADPYPAKVRIGGAIAVWMAAILFLGAFPACGNSDACSQVVGAFVFFGTCFFVAWKKPAPPRRFGFRASPSDIANLPRKTSADSRGPMEPPA